MGPRVATVILSWRDPALALRCAATVAAGRRVPELPIIVENEAAVHGHAPALRAGAPGMRVVEVAENSGYSGGMNAGLREAVRLGADHIVLVNNDSEFQPDTLERLVAEAERRPGAALVGAAQLLPDGALNGPFFHFRWNDGRVEFKPDPARAEPFIAACVVLVRAAALERLGYLDERFFMYCEDIDWSMRARRAGLELAGSADIVVRHELAKSSGGGNSPFFLYYDARNRFLLARHAPSAWARRRYILGTIARSIGQARRRARRGQAAEARAILAGVWAGLRGLTGRGMIEAPAPLRALAGALGLGARPPPP